MLARRMIVTLALPAVVAACAPPPDQIKAADIGPNPYAGYTCQQLVQKRNDINARLTQLSDKQLDAMAGDSFSVLVLGLPLASMSGANEKDSIATAKGHIQAIDAQLFKQQCAVRTRTLPADPWSTF